MFEFDEPKSKSNKAKHGIDFVEAQALWDDPYLLEVPAKTVDEPRSLVVGCLAGKHWSAIITYRGANVRIISVRGPGSKRLPCMKAKEFDRKFESGEDIIADLDLSKAVRPRLEQKRVNVDFPSWMVDELDKEAKRLGVTRQSVIKVWLSERLQQSAPSYSSQRTR